MKNPFRRRAAGFAAFGLALMAALGAQAQDYPSKPITFVVPWPAGGRTDIVGRMVASVFGSHLDQPVAVVNRVGGAGTLGTKHVLDAPKDGYTVLVTTIGNHVLQPVARDVGYVPSDFTPIGQVSSAAVILATAADKPWRSAEDLIAAAKEDPGGISYAAVKNVLPDLAVRALGDAAGAEFKLVPAQGDAEAVPMALGGHVDLVSASSLNSVAPLLESGDLRPLVVFNDGRLPELPDTPTAKELGYDVVANPWTGLAVAEGVPDDVVRKLRDTLAAVVGDTTFQKFAEQSKTDVVYLDGPAFGEAWERDFNTFKKVAGDEGGQQ